MAEERMSAVLATLAAGRRGIVVPSTTESTQDQGTPNTQQEEEEKKDEQDQKD